MTTSAPLFFSEDAPSIRRVLPNSLLSRPALLWAAKKLAVSRKVGEHIEPIALALGYRPNSYDQAIAWRP